MNAADNAKTPKWTDIASDPDFQASDWQTKQRVRGEFYRRAIEPNTPKELRSEVQSGFFNRTERDVFGERDSRGQKQEGATPGAGYADNSPGFASNALRNAGERGLDLGGNALKFIGNMAEMGEQMISDRLGGFNPGVIGGETASMRERGYDPDIEVGGYGLDFTARANPQDTGTGLIAAGEAVEDTGLGYRPNYTIDRALDDPSLKTLAGAAAEQGPAALADMAGLVINPPAYLASRTQEIGESRVENDGREGSPEAMDYAVAGPTAAASVLLDRFALGKLLPGGGKAVSKARDVPGAVGRAVGTESATEAAQEGGIEYAGESVGTKAGWDPVTAGRRAAGGIIVGGPTGGAVRAGSAAVELSRNNGADAAEGGPDEDGADQDAAQGESDQQSTPSPEADQANREAVGAATDLIRRPRFELSSAEREARDSIIHGDAFKAIRAMAEEQGDAEAVADLDAVSEEAASSLEDETLARSRGESLDAVRDQLSATADRFASAVERVESGAQKPASSPDQQADPESQAGQPGATYEYGGGNEAWRQAWQDRGVENPEQGLGDTTATVNGEQVAPAAGLDMSATGVDQAAAETDTNPTPAQAEAGNYRKGRVRINGFDIAIENPKGSTRRGTAPDGTAWESTMAHHYGDIKGTTASDGDNLDVFVGENPDSPSAFVVDQVNEDGSFDEVKIMLGFDSMGDARKGYLDNYEDGWQGMGDVTEVPTSELKEWVDKGDTQKPFAAPESLGLAMPGESTPQPAQESGAAGQASQEPAVDLLGDTPSNAPTDGRLTPQRVPVDQIEVDPDAYQFRTEVDKAGVDSRLEGVDKWDDLRAGNLILHERNNGQVFAADGHHRINLAKKLNQPDVNAYVLREDDGYSVEDARRLAAETNIAAGNASATDAAKVFRNIEGKPEDVIRERNLPSRSQVVRDGADIAKLGDVAFGSVLNKVVSEKDGAAIGRSFDDSDQQLAAVDVFQKVKPENENQRALLVNEVRQAGFAESQGDQGGLFGDDPAASLIGERVRVMDRLRQELVRDKRLFATLNTNAKTAELAGNRIATGQNEALQDASASAISLLERATTTPEINQQINDAARRVNDGEKVATVARELKETLLNGTNEQAKQSDRSPSGGVKPAKGRGEVERGSRPEPVEVNARAEDSGESRVGGNEGASRQDVSLKSDGQPFQTKRSAELSKRFRDSPGATAVETEGGWGFTVAEQGAGATERKTTDQISAELDAVMEPVNKRYQEALKIADPNDSLTVLDFATDAELTRRYDLIQSLPSQAQERYEARQNIERRAKARREARKAKASAADARGTAESGAPVIVENTPESLNTWMQSGDRVGRQRGWDVFVEDDGSSTLMTPYDHVGRFASEDDARAWARSYPGKRSGFLRIDGEKASDGFKPKPAPVVKTPNDATQAQPESQGTQGEAPLLESYTEGDIAAREKASQQAEQDQAAQRLQDEQRAQADAEAGDFSLTGSNRSADVAASMGQDDLLGASSGQNDMLGAQGGEQGSGRQPASTTSPEFKQWFGDSQVVSEDGTPKVMYHGTIDDFSEFKASRQSGGLLFFTGEPDVANAYAQGDRSGYANMGDAEMRTSLKLLARDNKEHFDGKRMLPVADRDTLSRMFFDSNIGEVESIGDRFDERGISAEQAVSEYNEFAATLGGPGSVMPVYLRAERPINSPDSPMQWKRAEQLGAEGLQDQGYDSVYITEVGTVALAVLDPKQVKSAFNEGGYSRDSADIRYAFAGERAQGANRRALSTAKERNESGEDAETIRRETGWFRGADGRWRFEINDSDASLKPALESLKEGDRRGQRVVSFDYHQHEDGSYTVTMKPEGATATSDFIKLVQVPRDVLEAALPKKAIRAIDEGQGVDEWGGLIDDAGLTVRQSFDFDGFNALPLDQTLDHPALFSAYPDLRDVMVQVDPEMGSGGSFAMRQGDTPVIRIGKVRQLSTLLHEVQHGIQNIEGFATGGSPSTVAATLRNRILRRAGKRGDGQLLNEYRQKSRQFSSHAQAKNIVDMRNVTQARQVFNSTSWYENRDGITRVFGAPPASGEARLQYAEQAGAWIANRMERSAPIETKEVLRDYALDWQSDPAARNKENRRLLNNATRRAERSFNKIDKDQLRSAWADKAEAGQLNDVSDDEAMSLYRRLYGEAEARNVQARQNMSETERLNTPVAETQDVADSDAIVLYNGEEMESAPSNAGTSGSARRDAPVSADSLTSAMAGQQETLGVSVVQSSSGLPGAALADMRNKGVNPQDVRGLYIDGELYVVADNVASIDEGVRVAVHEAVGHKGIREVLGDRLAPAMNQLYTSFPRDNSAWKQVKDRYSHIDTSTKAGRQEFTEELMAHLSETSPQVSAWQRFVSKVRDLLRKVFSSIKWTKGDAESLIDQGRRAIVGQNADQEAGAATRFSQAPPTESAAFKKWFGDSRVVDSDGAPQVVYHATNSDFDAFSTEGGSTSTGENLNASFFSESSEYAEAYSQERSDQGAQTIPAYVSLKNPLEVDAPADGFSDPRYEQGVIDEAREAGHDGVIFSDEMTGERFYAAFKPEQIKSAIGNRGTFDANNPDIRYNLNDSPDSGYGSDDSTGFAMPDERLRDAALRKMADKMRPLKILQDEIKKTGRNIEEEADTYLAEELFHGKVEYDLRQLQEQHVEPLAEGLAKSRISQEQLDDYLYARHAPERNATIAERNPDAPEMQDGGSGMTNAKAAEIIQRVADSGQQAEYDRLANIVYGMTRMRRDAIRDGGLEDDAMIDAWEAGWQNYVPLKGNANEDPGRPRTGKGFEISGRESRIAGGRLSLADSPSSQVIVDANESLIRRRKNEVAQSLLSMVVDHPNPSLWEVFTEDSPDTQRGPVRVKDPETGRTKIEVRESPVNMQGSQDYFKAKRAGRTYYIKMHDERLMNAMRNVGPESNNLLVRTASAATRVMSSMMTSYNPEFMLTNFTRDVQTALLNLSAEQTRDDGKIKGKAIVKGTARDIGPAMKAAWRGMQGKPGRGEGRQKWDKWFKEFQQDGAKTGYFDMKDINAQAKEIQSMVKRADGSTLSHMLKARKKTADFVENVNGAVENGVRLSAYANAREAGLSRKKAASLAKNMTVNFNRRGEVGTALNATYMFANASIQGSMNFARTMVTVKDTPGGKSRMNVWSRMNMAQKLGLGMATGAYMLGMLNRWVSEEDDDGVLFYDKVPSHVKERNIVLMSSLWGGDPDDYIKIPLPYGYNVFSVVGTHAEAVAAGTKDATSAATDLGLAVLGSFSPIGWEDSDNASGLFVKNLAPTLIRSVAQVGYNEDFAGRMIYRDEEQHGVTTPDSSRSMKSTPEPYKEFAKFLNEMTGGSDYREGAIDVNPDAMQHLVNYYGGGAWGFVEKTADFAARKASGDEVERYRAPFAGRFASSTSPYRDQGLFYDRLNELGQYSKEADALRGRDGMSFRRDNIERIRLYNLGTTIRQQLQDLRDRRDRVEAADQLGDEAKERRIEMIEKQMKRQVDGFNRRYNEMGQP